MVVTEIQGFRVTALPYYGGVFLLHAHLEGLGDVVCFYVFGFIEVGDGAGYFDDAVVGAGGKPQPFQA